MPWRFGSGEEPFYRTLVASELTRWRVVVGESDLGIISTGTDPAGVEALLRSARAEIEQFAAAIPSFLASLEPVAIPAETAVPRLVRHMLDAATIAGVGPFAAVAGTIAEEVCRFLARTQEEVIVENGGDVFIQSAKPRTCAVYAGDSPLSLRVGVRLEPDVFPCAVCTSSGTVGPSLSLGRADAAVVVGASGAVADAVATAAANAVQKTEDLQNVVEWATGLPGVFGAVAVLGSTLAAKGRLELVTL